MNRQNFGVGVFCTSETLFFHAAAKLSTLTKSYNKYLGLLEGCYRARTLSLFRRGLEEGTWLFLCGHGWRYVR